jgi:hypothetical protein
MNQKSNVKRLSKVSDTLSLVTKQIEELTDGDESAKAIWVHLRSAWSFLQGRKRGCLFLFVFIPFRVGLNLFGPDFLFLCLLG